MATEKIYLEFGSPSLSFSLLLEPHILLENLRLNRAIFQIESCY